MNTPTTDELLKRLNNTSSIPALDEYTQELSDQKPVLSFSQYINDCLRNSGLTPSQLIESAQIQRNYGYQILNGTKNPGRNKIIALCLALSLPLENVQRALTLAKEGILYPKNPRDAILIFCIKNKVSVIDTNLLLDSRGETPLSL